MTGQTIHTGTDEQDMDLDERYKMYEGEKPRPFILEFLSFEFRPFRFNRHILTTEGRVCRRVYYTYFIVITIICLIASFFKEDHMSVTNVIIGCAMWLFFTQTVKRFHDNEYSGWWILGFGVPILNIWLCIVPLIKGGDNEINKYGFDPHNMSIPSSYF